MVTGYASLQTAMQAINGGAAAYFVKPLDLERFFGVVERVVERQRADFEERRRVCEDRERLRELESRAAQLAEQVRRLEQENAALRRGGSSSSAGASGG
jgi:DNA-binding NtrC family response regulator